MKSPKDEECGACLWCACTCTTSSNNKTELGYITCSDVPTNRRERRRRRSSRRRIGAWQLLSHPDSLHGSLQLTLAASGGSLGIVHTYCSDVFRGKKKTNTKRKKKSKKKTSKKCLAFTL